MHLARLIFFLAQAWQADQWKPVNNNEQARKAHETLFGTSWNASEQPDTQHSGDTGGIQELPEKWKTNLNALQYQGIDMDINQEHQRCMVDFGEMVPYSPPHGQSMLMGLEEAIEDIFRGSTLENWQSLSPLVLDDVFCHEVCGEVFTNQSTLPMHRNTDFQAVPSEHSSDSEEHNDVERPYKCIEEDCGKSYSWLSGLRKHKRKHHKNAGIAPRDAHLSAGGTAQALTNDVASQDHRHVERMHLLSRPLLNKAEKAYPCTVVGCTSGCVSKGALGTHLRVIHGQKPRHEYECKTCRTTFPGRRHLYKHRMNNHGDVFICEVCGEVCEDQSGLNMHIDTHFQDVPSEHSSDSEEHGDAQRLYRCDAENCGKSYRWLSGLYRHKKKHQKKAGVADLPANMSPSAVEILVRPGQPAVEPKAPYHADCCTCPLSYFTSHDEFLAHTLWCKKKNKAKRPAENTTLVYKKHNSLTHVVFCASTWASTNYLTTEIEVDNSAHILPNGDYKCRLCSEVRSSAAAMKTHMNVSH